MTYLHFAVASPPFMISLSLTRFKLILSSHSSPSPLQAKFPSKYRFDEEGNLRVIADTLDFEGILDAAFNQIRQFSVGSPAVIIRLMEALTTIHAFTSKVSHKNAVIKHAEMVFSSGKKNIEEKNDIDDLTERAVKILNK